MRFGLFLLTVSIASAQRFTIGPMLELRLPCGAGLEFDALYKRFDQTYVPKTNAADLLVGLSF